MVLPSREEHDFYYGKLTKYSPIEFYYKVPLCHYFTLVVFVSIDYVVLKAYLKNSLSGAEGSKREDAL